MTYLQNLTEEQRKANLERARIARQEKAEAGKLLFHDFCDLPHWQKLAKKYGVRLPNSYIPNSDVKHLKKVIKKLGVDYKDYLEACGYSNFSQFHKDNPTWPLYAEVGLFLEHFDEKESNE